MAVPLPDTVVGAGLLMESDAYVVFADGDGIAGVGFEGIGLAGENPTDDLLFELGFFFGEMGLVGFFFFFFVVVIVGEVGIGGEEIFEGFREEGVGVEIRRADLELTQEALEEEALVFHGVFAVERGHGEDRVSGGLFAVTSEWRGWGFIGGF